MQIKEAILTQLDIYKAKELGKYILTCLLLLGGGHFFWTILCFMANIPRGY